jgi:hypothetical protein
VELFFSRAKSPANGLKQGSTDYILVLAPEINLAEWWPLELGADSIPERNKKNGGAALWDKKKNTRQRLLS